MIKRTSIKQKKSQNLADASYSYPEHGTRPKQGYIVITVKSICWKTGDSIRQTVQILLKRAFAGDLNNNFDFFNLVNSTMNNNFIS